MSLGVMPHGTLYIDYLTCYTNNLSSSISVRELLSAAVNRLSQFKKHHCVSYNRRRVQRYTMHKRRQG